ncbi:MAG: hypothetical protein ABSE73_12770 [Planctomycetota bacterium]
MKPSDCPKFQACSAPLCPLDVDWRLRAHNPEDRCCRYLLESQKAGAEGRLDPAMLAACRQMVQAQAEMPSALRIALKRAATSGTRLEPTAGFQKTRGRQAPLVVQGRGNDRETVFYPCEAPDTAGTRPDAPAGLFFGLPYRQPTPESVEAVK